ncbi:MAG: Gfo/Idh/MocA family oxidoreductase [Kiritimatiellia bacterium]
MNIGIIGCGNISGIYVKNFTSGLWPQVTLRACADLEPAKAQAIADAHPDIQALAVDELLADPEIGLVLNLTVPQAHHPVGLACVRAGKHHYSEKPMALTMDQAAELQREAEACGVRLGCAPDTFLGAGTQTAVQAVKDELIGKPVSVMGHMICRGHESWHPAPTFYYQQGGGPLMDMGPYYLTAMVAMLGKVRSVQAINRKTFPTRTITSEPLNGTEIPVEVDTHITALLDFECGAVGTLITSFDGINPGLPPITLSGTEGGLRVPDPNTFGGDVVLVKNKEETVLPHVNAYAENSRGLGVAEMVTDIENDSPHQANGELAAHVLWIMQEILSFQPS